MTAVHPGRVDHGASAGTVGRRRALPTGRAVAGAFFVAVAVVVVFAAWLAGAGGSGRPWVVALRDLPAGVRLAPSDLGTQRMTLPGTTARVAFSTPAGLVGQVLAAPIRTGELVQAGDVSSPRAGVALRPVTVDVAPSDLTVLSLGAVVDVLVTDGTDPASPTSVVVARARVLDVGRPSSSLIAGASGAELTVGVTTLAQVTSIVHAAHTGTLSVVVGAPGDTATAGAGAPGAATGGAATGGAATGGAATGGAATGGGGGAGG